MANRKSKNNENVLPIRDLLFHCIAKWWWFAISLTTAMGAAVVYILSTPPVYVRSAEILIKEAGKGGGSNSLNNFATEQSTADAGIEMQALRSPGIIRQVIDRLDIDIDYKGKGRFHNDIIYMSCPIKVTTIDLRESDAATFTATLSGDSNLLLSDFTKNGNSLTGNVKANIGDTVATPVGRLTIATTQHYGEFAGQEILVEKKNLNATINGF